MSEYMITLIGNYADFEKEVNEIAKVVYISQAIQGLIGVETHLSKENLEKFYFIVEADAVYLGRLLNTP